MRPELSYIKFAIERVCKQRSFISSKEFEDFLSKFLQDRFTTTEEGLGEELSVLYRTRPKDLEIAIEDAIVRFKHQEKKLRR
jgi:hypothetical protein